MTWRDKLEIGLKPDAPFRRDNLPDDEVHGPERPAGPGRSPVVSDAERHVDVAAVPKPRPAKRPRRPRKASN
jgi:hypothetical protein